MSTEVAGTTVTESVPTSTTDTATEVLESFEAAEAEIQVSGDTPEPAGDDTATIREPEPIASPSEAALLLKEAGFDGTRRPDGRENRIPYSKVTKIIENGLKKGRTEWETAKQAIERERDEARTFVDQVRRAVTGDPVAFLRDLASQDQRYASFLQPTQETKPLTSDLPEPDVELPGGGKTYSVEGLQKLIEHVAASKIKPYEERDRETRQQAQQRQLEQARADDVRASMQEAQSWPLFGQLPAGDAPLSPFQLEVLSELQKDSDAAKSKGRRPTMTLRQAYLEVHARHQNPDEVRKRVIADLQKAPKSTAVTRGTTDAVKAPGPASTQEVASRVIDRLERGA